MTYDRNEADCGRFCFQCSKIIWRVDVVLLLLASKSVIFFTSETIMFHIMAKISVAVGVPLIVFKSSHHSLKVRFCRANRKFQFQLLGWHIPRCIDRNKNKESILEKRHVFQGEDLLVARSSTIHSSFL
jgi:hypothetical protein